MVDPSARGGPPASMSAGDGMLHIGLFFDGTRNNARNLALQRHPPSPLPRPPAVRAGDASPYQSRLTSSYDNGPTNIARLHRLYPDTRRVGGGPLSLAIYTEGTGTRDGRPDDLIGLAFGTGATGIRAKVDRALQAQLPEALRALARATAAPVRSVRIDLFGYSRGAACAREAASELQGWPVARWQALLHGAGLAMAPSFALPVPAIRFIGLFDTVVALSGRHVSAPLRLYLPVGIADKVVQLVARDEHREHFALTSVAPEHEEIALPGSHANVGGGCDQDVEGPKLLTRPRSQAIARPPFAAFTVPDRAWLQATASHRQARAEAVRWRQRLGVDDTALWVDSWHQWVRQRHAGSRSALPEPTLYVYSAVVLKRPIDWRYQLVALRLMHRRAQRAGVAWTHTPDEVTGWALPDDLQAVSQRLLDGQALTNDQDALLRRRYLMQSAHWNFDALGDTALAYAAEADVRELPYRPGPGLFYINRPTADGRRVVRPNV